MARTIKIVLRDGETLQSAVRRFKQRVKEDILADVKKHSFYLKPVERKRNRKKPPERSDLFATAVEHAGKLPKVRQDEIAVGILAGLGVETDPRAKLFQELVEAKYTRGLTSKENARCKTSDPAALSRVANELLQSLLFLPRLQPAQTGSLAERGVVRVGIGFVDLCASSFSEHFVQQRNGKWRGKTLAAKYTIDSMRLNRSHLVELRRILRDLIDA